MRAWAAVLVVAWAGAFAPLAAAQGPQMRQPQTEQPVIRPRLPVDPTQRQAVPPEALQRLPAQLNGPWELTCRPGGDMTMTIRVLDTREMFSTTPAVARWRLELRFRRAPQGHARRALQPGECAQADLPAPGGGEFIELRRIVDAYPTRFRSQPLAVMRQLEVTDLSAGPFANTLESTFDILTAVATVGPEGRRVDNGRGGHRIIAPYAPFRVRAVRCTRSCGLAPSSEVFYADEAWYW